MGCRLPKKDNPKGARMIPKYQDVTEEGKAHGGGCGQVISIRPHMDGGQIPQTSKEADGQASLAN